MGNILNEAIEKSNQFQHKLIDENKEIVNKWEKTGLLEGIDHAYEKSSMAVLLENQAKQLLSEISKTGGANSEEWSGVALPLVRRIFGDISSKEFVSVQPMTLPSGLVFYLDIKYGTAQPGFSTTPGATNQGDSVFGITATSSDATRSLWCWSFWIFYQ